MSENPRLLSVSNAILSNSKSEEPVSRTGIYVRNAIIVGLALFGGLSVLENRKNTRLLNKPHLENQSLSAEVEHFRRDAANLALENLKLWHYANEAESFVNSIHPPYADFTDCRNAKEEAEAKREYARAQKEYDKACQVFGFDQAQLMYLQKGPEK